MSIDPFDSAAAFEKGQAKVIFQPVLFNFHSGSLSAKQVYIDSICERLEREGGNVHSFNSKIDTNQRWESTDEELERGVWW